MDKQAFHATFGKVFILPMLFPYWLMSSALLAAYWHLGGVNHPNSPKISETTGRMPIKLLPGVKYHREVQNPNFYITHLVSKLWVSKVNNCSNRLFSRNPTSGHSNVTNLCRIINIDVKN